MQQFNKKVQNKKLTTAEVYGGLPVWKVMTRVGLPALLTSFMTALFTFVDLLLLVNLMPLTQQFDFYHLFLFHENIFNNLINNIQDKTLKHLILTNNNVYENFINYIANTNNLHFYDTASTVRIASSLISPLTFLITAITGLLLPGGNVLFSKALSVKNYLKLTKVWQNEFYSALIITFLGMILIYILNYTMIESMVNGSINTNINPNSIVNNLNNNYCYVIKNNEVYFLIKNNNQYVNFKNFESILNTKIQTFNIKNNNQIVASTFVHYYLVVKQYSVRWAQDFVAIITSGLWISSIVRLNVNIIRSHGRTLLITLIMVCDTILNIILDYILIYYAQIGMDGAAVATLISWCVALVPLITYFNILRKQGLIKISYKQLMFHKVMFNKKIINQMLLISISYLVSIIGYMIVRVLLINQISYVTEVLYPNLGDLYFISITGAVYPIMNLFQNTISGFMTAGTSIVAYNYGTKRYDRLKIIVFEISLFIIVIGSSILGLFGFCSPISDWILGLFNVHYAIGNNSLAYLYECSRKFLWISLMILPFQGLGNSAFMLFRTSKKYYAATFVGILRSMLVIIPYLYIFSTIASHSIIHIDNIDLAKNNPLYNPNIWLLLWTQSAATITTNLITLLWIIFYLYKGIYKENIKFKNTKICLYFQKRYLVKILNETKLK